MDSKPKMRKFGGFGRNRDDKEREAIRTQPWRGKGLESTVDDDDDKENAPPTRYTIPALRSSTICRTPLSTISANSRSDVGHAQSQLSNIDNALHGHLSTPETSKAPEPAPTPVQEPSAEPAREPAQEPTPKPSAEPEVDEEGFQAPRKKTRRPKASVAPESTTTTDGPGGDWLANRALQHAAAASRATKATRKSSYTIAGLKTRDKGVLFTDQKPGTICRRWDFRPCLDPNAQIGHAGVVEGPDGRPWIHVKHHFLIIAAHRESVTEATIFSHHDTGLAGKPSWKLEEYLSLKPRHASADFVNQSPNNPVLEVGTVYGKNCFDRETSTVHITDINTRPYKRNDLERLGELTKESTEIAVEYAVKAIANQLRRKDDDEEDE